MNELIDALRNCACIKNEDHCKICGYRHSTECGRRIADDAADAIERLMDERDKLREAYNAVHKEYGKECYAFRFGYLDQTVKLILGITEDNNEQQS